jgi:uncharacterized repeat protein (TIGR04042 family)
MPLPEMHFIVRWPDDSRLTCYSPSLVIEEYLAVGTDYPLADFVERSRNALTIASERVYAKFGFACIRADAQIEQIERVAARFGDDASAQVRVEAFER